jgi:acetyl esterase/lipase
MTHDRNPITLQKGLDIFKLKIPARDDAPITLRIYRRTANRNDALPRFLYMHSGGYVTGGLETDDLTCIQCDRAGISSCCG